ncbi:hypothetical protein N9M31_06945 [Alphaproteobacteria bacterium]|nr:hypothetical protein [Alphaproteobacteria bacterium]
MARSRLLIFALVGYLSSASSAFAYLDPGSGSVIIQMLVAFAVAIGSSIAFCWNKVVLFVQKVLGIKNKITRKDVE